MCTMIISKNHKNTATDTAAAAAAALAAAAAVAAAAAITTTIKTNYRVRYSSMAILSQYFHVAQT